MSYTINKKDSELNKFLFDAIKRVTQAKSKDKSFVYADTITINKDWVYCFSKTIFMTEPLDTVMANGVYHYNFKKDVLTLTKDNTINNNIETVKKIFNNVINKNNLVLSFNCRETNDKDIGAEFIAINQHNDKYIYPYELIKKSILVGNYINDTNIYIDENIDDVSPLGIFTFPRKSIILSSINNFNCKVYK